MFHRILIAVGTREASERSIQIGGELATQAGAILQLLHVVTPPIFYDPSTVAQNLDFENVCVDESSKMLDELRLLLPAALSAQVQILEGRPCDTIIAQAKEWHADLVIVGDHNHNVVSRFLVGSTADAVVRHAPCPVLVVRKQQSESPLAACDQNTIASS